MTPCKHSDRRQYLVRGQLLCLACRAELQKDDPPLTSTTNTLRPTVEVGVRGHFSYRGELYPCLVTKGGRERVTVAWRTKHGMPRETRVKVERFTKGGTP